MTEPDMTKPEPHRLIEVFVPCALPHDSAVALYDEDLAKQPGEILRCLNAMHADVSASAYNDPTARAWRGFDAWLAFHGLVYSIELLKRGHDVPEMSDISLHYSLADASKQHGIPGWWDGEHHEQHKMRLVMRNPHYATIWPDVDMTLQFSYPGPENEVFRQDRNVVTLEQEARRLQALATEARMKADAAMKAAVVKVKIKDEVRQERNEAKFGRNGWKV